MRGADVQYHTLFSYVRPDSRIPANHPLRLIRKITDAALSALSDKFDAAYATDGRPSIPPERLLRASLIQAWASMKSFRRKDGEDQPPSNGRNGERDVHKEKRTNETHASTTDSDARLYRKGRGREAKLAFIGHLLMENRNGLVVDADMTKATGTAEPEAALAMLGNRPGMGRVAAGADKAYDTTGFAAGVREINVTPHVAQNINEHRGSNIDARTTRHPGYAASQVIRKRIEEANRWIKIVAGMDRAPFRGLPRMCWMFKFRSAAYNLIRLPGLLPTG